MVTPVQGKVNQLPGDTGRWTCCQINQSLTSTEADIKTVNEMFSSTKQWQSYLFNFDHQLTGLRFHTVICGRLTEMTFLLFKDLFLVIMDSCEPQQEEVKDWTGLGRVAFIRHDCSLTCVSQTHTTCWLPLSTSSVALPVSGLKSQEAPDYFIFMDSAW